MTSPATVFVDNTARDARELEIPAASFVNGMNNGASNAPGVGINMLEGAIIGTPEQFTLLDQFGNARAAQISQSIGGFPFVDRVADAVPYPGSGGTEGTAPDAVIQYGNSPTQAAKDAAEPSIDGGINIAANATLNDIALGWVANA